MADGDYERGRGREIAEIQARLRALAKARADSSSDPLVLVLNGWAAAPEAWSLCRFRRDRLFSYVQQLDGEPEAFLAETAGRSVVLVGWSMGGSYALRLACAYPARVAGLVLVAATPRMMEVREEGWRGMNERRLDALLRGLEITHGEGFFGVPPGLPNPYMMDVPENLRRGLDYLLATDLRADLAKAFPAGASFPVHIFQSEHDGIVRHENAAYLKTVFPCASVTIVPGTEHALPIFIPKEIDDAVDACLAVAAKGQDPRRERS